MRDAVEAYFTQLRDIHNSGAGVAETSYYGPLASLLTDVGHGLKPKVSAIINLRNTGAGIPDGGLFTASQLKGWTAGSDTPFGQLPSRGAIEVKPPGDDAFSVAKSEQVARYVERYGLVLVTNLRDFVLVGRDAEGSGIRALETLQLAKTESGFWSKVQQPRKYAADAGEGLTEFLQRVLLHNAPLSDPKDLAWFLASYARTARLRLEQKHELPALGALRSQLEDALGLKFEGEKGDHFFRSTLVQTLFYGMFAAWVLWARGRDRNEETPWESRFQWETATATLHVPMVYELFRQFADVKQLGQLGISEVLEWAEEALWRVQRGVFFDRFQEHHAVQYFYEPFLEAFDPDLRKELGVWYTPDEVVKYMVARVDWALREELGIPDGLADPSVVVLDPCCGTGAYLVEVLRKIDETLTAKGADALTRHDVKRAALQRVIGFEIMPAPFVVAHLQMGILLAELGVPLRDAEERAAIYLTNALTGWGKSDEPPREKRGVEGQLHSTLLFPEFAEERDAADRVKREERILVVIGNPPYNGYAGVAQDEEAELVAPYKLGLAKWGISKNYLDDLYIRFTRLAERTIDRSGRGVVCLISNFSWLADPSAVVMRESVLSTFGTIVLDSLNGDSRETGKRTPDGDPDPSIFSGQANASGIQVGTAVATMIAGADRTHGPLYRDLWGAGKRSQLRSEAAGLPSLRDYVRLNPVEQNRFALRPYKSAGDYSKWPSIVDLTTIPPSLGLNENRGGGLVDADRDSLRDRMTAYLDADIELADLPGSLDGLKRAWARFDPSATRRRLVQAGVDESRLLPFLMKPFDAQWAYAEPRFKLWNEARAPMLAATAPGTRFILARARSPRAMDGAPVVVFTGIADQHALHKDAYLIPLQLQDARESLLGDTGPIANVSSRAARYLDALGADSDDASAVWAHVVAISYAPTYQRENADAIRSDWLRVPLPTGLSDLRKSAALGERAMALLDVSPMASTKMGIECAVLGVLSSVTSALNPGTDLEMNAQWGIAGRGGITMPSTGKLEERSYTEDEREAIAKHAVTLGLSAEQAIELLGATCFDVYLNDKAYWRCVPSSVWRYTIGGFQVTKKWLSYREKALLGRDLEPEEARYVTEMVRRIAALILMQPELDENYEQVKADVWEWQRTK